MKLALYASIFSLSHLTDSYMQFEKIFKIGYTNLKSDCTTLKSVKRHLNCRWIAEQYLSAGQEINVI